MLVVCKNRKRFVRNVLKSDRKHFYCKETFPVIRKAWGNSIKKRQEIDIRIKELKSNKQEDKNRVQVKEKETVLMLLHMK